jgi:hypothetical protein
MSLGGLLCGNLGPLLAQASLRCVQRRMVLSVDWGQGKGKRKRAPGVGVRQGPFSTCGVCVHRILQPTLVEVDGS